MRKDGELAIICLIVFLILLAGRHHDRPEAQIDASVSKADWQYCRPVSPGPIQPTRPVDPYGRKKDVA